MSNPHQEIAAATRVHITAVRPGLSPRLGGEDSDHVRRLAEVEELLPPILVHRKTMKIIDGVHRWLATAAIGRKDIDVRYFDGSEEEATLLAVSLNLAHGLPLKLEDRKAAARRVLVGHPDWSDRRVGEATGLSPKTVAAVRTDPAHSAEEIPQLTSRVGRDNRRRAMQNSGSSSATRHPGGVAVPSADRLVPEHPAVAGPRLRLERRSQARLPTANGAPGRESVDSAAALATLRGDPSIRSNEPGRGLLRLLSTSRISNSQWRRIADAVPPYRRNLVADLAEQCAEKWHTFARALREQTEPDKHG